MKIDWVRIIALMPFVDSEMNPSCRRPTGRPINYAYLGVSLFLMILLPILTWDGIHSLNDVADLEMSAFAPLTAMWGLGLPIQCLGRRSLTSQRAGIIIPNAYSSHTHSAQERGGEQDRGYNVNVFFQFNLQQNFYQVNSHQEIYSISVNQDIHIQNTIVFFPSASKFVSSATQDITPMRMKRGPKFLPRVANGEDPLNDGIRAKVDIAFQHLGYNLKNVDGAAIINLFKKHSKEFLRKNYEKKSLCTWLLRTYGVHFSKNVTAEIISHSSPSIKRQRQIDELFGYDYYDIN